MQKSEQLGPVCFVDTETTGLDPDHHEIWEVALIVPDAGADDTWTAYEWQLPVDLGRADVIALNIGQFHDRRAPVSSLTYPAQFASEFVRLTRGLHLVGAVVSFDADRLWRLLRQQHECGMWHYHVIDCEGLAAGYLATGVAPKAWPGVDYGKVPIHLPPWDSRLLSLGVGVDPDRFDRHTALGDAYWAKAVYEAVMG